MADMKLIIKIPEEMYAQSIDEDSIDTMLISYKDIIKNGTPLTADILVDLLMEERIRGELKQDIFYLKDVIDNVRCRLTLDIIDRRPCYCGVELREVWRESEGKK